MSFRFTVIVQKEEDWYVAKCTENNIASQGKTIDESLENLKEALALYYEDSEKPSETSQTFVTSVEVTL